MCHWLGFLDPTNPILLHKSCILSQPRSSLIKPSLKGSWPWSVARTPRQLGATLRPYSLTSIALANSGRKVCGPSYGRMMTASSSCL